MPKTKYFLLVVLIISLLSVTLSHAANSETRFVVKINSDNDVAALKQNNIKIVEKEVSGGGGKFISRASAGIRLKEDFVVVESNKEDIKEILPDSLVEEDFVFQKLGELEIYPLMNISLAHKEKVFGKGIKVAILDTGISQQLMNSNYLGGFDFVNEDENPIDDEGHGTAIASILIGNEEEFYGISPEVSLYSVKVLDNRGSGHLSDLLDGLNYAKEAGVDIVILSLGSKVYSEILEQKIKELYYDDILVIAAAGNDGGSVFYPAKYEETIAVGGIENDGSLLEFSSRGEEIDFVAPASNIDVLNLDGSLRKISGTSIAVPQVGALAALFKSRGLSLTNNGLKNILIEHSYDLGEIGKDSLYGYGLPQYSFVEILSGDVGGSGDLVMCQSFISDNPSFSTLGQEDFCTDSSQLDNSFEWLSVNFYSNQTNLSNEEYGALLCQTCSVNSYETAEGPCSCGNDEECEDIYTKSTAIADDGSCEYQTGSDYCLDSNTVMEAYIDCYFCDEVKWTEKTCSQNYACSDGRCVYSPEGVITSVSWSKIEAVNDEFITLTVNTANYPNGESVTFRIYEDDVAFDNELSESPWQTTISNNKATVQWKARYTEELYPNNAEYYFKVFIDGKDLKSSTIPFRLGHENYDCEPEASQQCASNLICDGNTDITDFENEGCCYIHENWNNQNHECKIAIQGNMNFVRTNSNNEFETSSLNYAKIRFKAYETTLGADFYLGDYIYYPATNTYQINPENHFSFWNTNLGVKNYYLKRVQLLDSNDEILAEWSTSFSNDNDYRNAEKSLVQEIMIHTDKSYWNKAEIYGLENGEVKEDQRKVYRSNSAPGLDILSSQEINYSSSEEAEIISARWSGTINITEKNKYYFHSTSNGGFRLIIDNQFIIDDWENTGDKVGDVNLDKGIHNLIAEYYVYMPNGDPSLYFGKSASNLEFVPKDILVQDNFEYQVYKEDISGLSISEEDIFSSLLVKNSFPDYQVATLEKPQTINSAKTPTLLIHGLHGESSYWRSDDSLKDNLEIQGMTDLWEFTYPNDQSIEQSSVLLSDGIQRVLTNYPGKKTNIVAHSMGGLVTKAYIKNISKDDSGRNYRYNNNINKFISLSSPFYGSSIANRVVNGETLGSSELCEETMRILGLLDFDENEPAIKDLMLGSDFIYNLNNKPIGDSFPTENILNLIGDQHIPCFPYITDSFDDGYVSGASSNHLSENIPLVIVNRNHGGIFGINIPVIADEYETTSVARIIKRFVNGQSLLTSDYEEYLTTLNNGFTEGELIVSTSPATYNDLKLKIQSKEYPLTKNQVSGKWYHYNFNPSDEDGGQGIPVGTYDILSGSNKVGEVEIKALNVEITKIDTCQDGIQNINEEGVDCGSTCGVVCCTPNWVIQQNWSQCTILDLQFKDWVDNNLCGNNLNKPAKLNQTCDFCFPNWTEEKSACLTGDKMIGTFNDTKGCFAQTGLSSDLLNRPENITYNFVCDYNGDGFIGNISNVNTTVQNLSMEKQNETYMFKENNETLLEFEINLTNSSLNFGDLQIEKQDNDAALAYLLIKGIDLTSQNKTKTAYLDKILGGTGLCIKDEEFSSISEVSAECIGENETWIACPGVNGEYSCNLTSNETRYVITGLKHSGIKEQETYCGDAVCNGAESCSVCSLDCGSCPPSGGNGGGGGGGGGSGGGGGGGSVSTVNKQVVNNETIPSDDGSGGGEDNKTSVPTGENPVQNQPRSVWQRVVNFFRGGSPTNPSITGAVVGAEEGSGGRNGSLLIALIVIVGVAGILIWHNKRKKKLVEKTSSK